MDKTVTITLPVEIGESVYVIAACSNVTYIPDGDPNLPGDISGYYCPYYIRGNCPHAYKGINKKSDCTPMGDIETVFRDIVCSYLITDNDIVLFTKYFAVPCEISRLNKDNVFTTKEAADKAFKEMNQRRDVDILEEF